MFHGGGQERRLRPGTSPLHQIIEMNTRMHAAAIPDVDPNTLDDPAEVAERIVELIEQVDELPTGARVVPGGQVAA